MGATTIQNLESVKGCRENLKTYKYAMKAPKPTRARELQRALQTRRGLPRFWHRSSFCDSQLNQVNRIGKS